MDHQHTQDLHHLIAQAQHLIHTLTTQQEAEHAAYQRGLTDAAHQYRAIFDLGRDVGYITAEHDLDHAHRLLAQKVRAMAKLPTAAELKERRSRPRGHIWEAEMQRRSGRPYLGGPVHYETGQPATNSSNPWASRPGAAA